MRVGVDIGGTFTDLVLEDDGQLRIHKRLSTPQDPAQSMLAGLNDLTGGDLNALSHVIHGSTVATNAILERKGARIALITTQGFRDVLFIGRQNRPDLYALHPTLPPPLIPRERCYEIPERLDPHGEVLLPLDEAALDAVLDDLAAQQIDAVAVCLLYSFVNPDHEQRIRQRIVERGLLDAWQVALSSEVLPEFREYERAATVALEAYVRPIMARYIDRLRAQLPAHTGLAIMKSDGGIMSAGRIRDQAVQTALSGPAAGVIGALHLATVAGYPQIITLDMGGTSTDVALCPGQAPYSAQRSLDDLPLRLRLIDIETIGAGGGSIARVDAGGALRVGPESAGAEPGPLVYGRGGTEVTVSDANALLGRLDAEHFLGGQMRLDIDSALPAVGRLAQALNRDIQGAAQGIIDVANANIDRALRRVSVARGHDPRAFTLVAFGGAGPLHACEIAERLGMPRVLVPRHPGVLCALGLLVADAIIDSSRAVLAKASRGLLARLRATQAELLAEGRDALRQEGYRDEQMQFNVVLDMRYVGQAHELTVPFTRSVVDTFHQAHEATYGHALRDRPIEVINMRLQAISLSDKPALRPKRASKSRAADASLGSRPTADGEIHLYDRDRLTVGAQFAGEALIFQLDSTIYIPPGWHATIDAYENLIIERLAQQ